MSGRGAAAQAAVLLFLLVGPVAAAPPPFANPPELVSAGGVLTGTFTIAPVTLTVAGKTVDFPGLYNGLYMPPLLRVQPGDNIRLTLVNNGPNPTNVHYHGVRVTPLGNSDNVFLNIPTATTFNYDVPIPATHPSGLYWYHPHFHPLVNEEIASGLSGGMIVGDILAPFPELAGIPERVMLLKDLKVRKGQLVDDPDPSGATLRTINGIYKPRIDMQPGQMEFWRIANIGANIYYELKLGGRPFYVIAQDGNLQNQATPTKVLPLPPGKRLEVLVYGPPKGKHKLHAMAFNTGPAGDQYPAQLMATVVSKGPQVDRLPIPSTFPPVTDLRQSPIAQTRTVPFADAGDGFTINGKAYDENTVDTLVNLGDVEEWTIQNTSKELHVFHIHQLDFQVTEINGVPQSFVGLQDTVSLPFRTKAGPGTVKVILPFTDPVIVGEFVYHCHIVQHADQGMMANIMVVNPAGPETPPLNGAPGHSASHTRD